MKNKSLITTIIILFIYLSLVVVWGTSMVVAIVEEDVIWANIWVLSSILLFFAIFFVDAYSKDYKFKYIFLGKNFKKQRDEFFKKNKDLSKKEKRQILKNMKHNYRRFGSIEFAVYGYVVTPIKLYFEDYISFSYGNALDEQKVEYIIYNLYSKNLTGGGFYRFFEQMAEEPFSFEEYKRIVKKAGFSKKLNAEITNATSKKVFEYFKRYNELLDEEHKFLEKYELDESNKLFEYQTEIFDLVENIAMKKFFDYHKTRQISIGAVKSFISKDNLKRITICFLEDLKVYNIVREEFTFFDIDMPQIQSDGGWVAHEGNSYYETEEQALNDIKNELEGCIELNLN